MLRQRANALRGILNGIDIDLWDPATDQAIANALVWLADTHLSQGRIDDAEPLLQRARDAHPESVAALYHSGRLALMRNHAYYLHPFRLRRSHTHQQPFAHGVLIGEGLGGQVLVDSAPDVGTRVSLLLPLFEASTAAARQRDVA